MAATEWVLRSETTTTTAGPTCTSLNTERSILYRNNGDGTFTDITEKAGVAAPGWASRAVWFDYDNDGRLDLFVCRFVDFDKAQNKFCGKPSPRPADRPAPP